MEKNNQKEYYVEQTYTFLVQHTLENVVEKCLQDNNSIRLINGENGSNIIIIKKADVETKKA